MDFDISKGEIYFEKQHLKIPIWAVCVKITVEFFLTRANSSIFAKFKKKMQYRFAQGLSQSTRTFTLAIYRELSFSVF